MALIISWTEIGVLIAILVPVISGLIWLVKKLQNLEDRIKKIEDNPLFDVLDSISQKNAISILNKKLSKHESKNIRRRGK
jgi:hypothetical protein